MSLLDKMIVNTIPVIPKPLVGYFSKNYIAGPNLEDAIRVVKDLNSKGMMGTLDLLGEEVKLKKQAEAAGEEYLRMLSEINNQKLDCNVSVKPTHLGLKLDNIFFYNNIKQIVKKAQELNNFVRIDMEDHTVTSATIETYLKLKKEFGNHVGTVIQSYLKRTKEDICSLSLIKANLRLCKGIYVEPENIAFKNMLQINESYKQSLEELLKNQCYTGIATHDESLLLHALDLIEDLQLPKSAYEFQMLLGVTEHNRDKIVKRGHRIRIYVPYGQDWYHYSVRRLKENPRMAKMIFNKILGLSNNHSELQA
jgi:proline dehydrogenase